MSFLYLSKLGGLSKPKSDGAHLGTRGKCELRVLAGQDTLVLKRIFLVAVKSFKGNR